MAYKPEFPYRGKQIIIDSDRVLLNSKNDATFIVGNKAVSISSAGTINLDSTGDCIVNSPSIKLGLTAKHPLVKGDTLQTVLNEFIKILSDIVAENMSTAKESNGAKIIPVNLAGQALKEACANLSNRLAEITSLNNYTE